MNAFALDARSGIVLVDTGINEDGAMRELERALAEAGRTLEDVELLICSHAHSDHYGLAAPIVEAAGCELWMHPRHEHATRAAQDPERALERRIEVARQSGVPVEPLRRWAERRREEKPSIAGVVLPNRELVQGAEVETRVGTWTCHETPGHAPSHVVLFQPERRLMISGDHVLGRVSLYFDYGWTPDPVAEFLSSLDVAEQLGPRLCLPGHGRPFGDVGARIDANRLELSERLERTAEAIGEGEATAFELVDRVFGQALDPMMTNWMLTMVLCYLGHLEQVGQAERVSPETPEHPERWRAPAPTGARP